MAARFIAAISLLLALALQPVFSDSVPLRVNCGAKRDVRVNGVVWKKDYGWIQEEKGRPTTRECEDEQDKRDCRFNKNQQLHEVDRRGWYPGFKYEFYLDYTGDYVVRLYFAEYDDFESEVGGRVFGVNINGKECVEKVDIYREAGRKQFTEVVRQCDVTLRYNKKLVIDFTREIDDGNSWVKVSAIEVLRDYHYGKPTPRPTYRGPPYSRAPTPKPTYRGPPFTGAPTRRPPYSPDFSLMINVGSDKSYTDANGNEWIADKFYSGGKTWTSSKSISDTRDDALYQSERFVEYGNLEYELKGLPDGKYMVQLLFAEIFDDIYAKGKRVFDVKIEGDVVDRALDIYDEVGQYSALQKEYGEFEITDGTLMIELVARVENPKLSGIAVKLLAGPGDKDSECGLPDSTWKYMADMPNKLSGLSAAATDDSSFYVFGGYNEDGFNTHVWKYSIWGSRGSWSEMKDAKWFARGEGQTQQVYDGDIYAFGGASDEGHRMRKYDPKADDWTQLRGIWMGGDKYSPIGASSGIIGDKIYVAGGLVDGTAVNTVYEYDISENKWTQMPDMPRKRNHAAGVAYDGIFYVFGGRYGTEPDNSYADAFAYDPKDRSWSRLSDMSVSTSGTGQAVEYYGKLMVFGGEDEYSAMRNVQVYDPSTDEWSELDHMPSGRHGISAVRVRDTVYIPGGAPSGGHDMTDKHLALEFESR